MEFDYFYGRQPEQYAFYRTPKVFFTDDRFAEMTAEAKLLYGILLDRMSLSIKNAWTDEEGRNYIYMTIESMEMELGYSHQKIGKLLSELEDFGLIERKRQGIGRPNIIYVKNFYTEYDSSTSLSRISNENVQNQHSRMSGISIQECPKSACNNTDINNTNMSNTNLSIYRGGIEDYYDFFKRRLSIDRLIEEYPLEEEQILEILSIISETMSTGSLYIKIEGQRKSSDIVKSQLMKLDKTHIEYVLEGLANNSEPIKNVKQYIITCLYNAPITINSYYQAKVNGNMRKEMV